MERITLDSVHIENFKGCTDCTYDFSGENVSVNGVNGSGKTRIFDAYLWCLFDRDSEGNAKFGIRSVTADGQQIDNTDIVVELVFCINGVKKTFKKIQRQKWTKHRGSTATTFEGNANFYEIDGFPQSEKEYKAQIESMISVDNFMLVSDIGYFAGLDWKKRRQLLLWMCGDVTDEDVLNSDSEHWEPIASDVRAAGVDKAREKARKALSQLNKDAKEIPVRIDEASKGIEEVKPISGLVESQNDLTARLADLETEKAAVQLVDYLSPDNEEIDSLHEKLKEIEDRVNRKAKEERSKAIEDFRKATLDAIEAEREKDTLEREIVRIKAEIAQKQAELNNQAEIYKSNKTAVPFDLKAQTCRYCGQLLPTGKINEAKKRHEEEESAREARKENAKKTGFEIKAAIKSLEQKLSETQAKLDEAKARLTELEKEREIADKKNSSSGSAVDPKTIPEYLEIHEKIEALKAEAKRKEAERGNKLVSIDEEIRKTTIELRRVTEEIRDIESAKQRNEEIQNRIQELEAKQKSVGQKIAFCEMSIVLLEEFSIKKAEMLSQKVKNNFGFADFSLFQKQINGGLVEECEIVYNGVKYKDLNNGHRIAVSLDIIRAFQKKLGIFAPVFIDNAESINTCNIPEMGDCQIIRLCVTDDSPIKVVKP